MKKHTDEQKQMIERVKHFVFGSWQDEHGGGHVFVLSKQTRDLLAYATATLKTEYGCTKTEAKEMAVEGLAQAILEVLEDPDGREVNLATLQEIIERSREGAT